MDEGGCIVRTGKSRRSCEDDIKMDIKMVSKNVLYINVDHDSAQRRALVNTKNLLTS